MGIVTPVVHHSSFLQPFNNSLSGTMEPGFDGADRFPHHAAYRFVRHLFVMEEDEDLTVFMP